MKNKTTTKKLPRKKPRKPKATKEPAKNEEEQQGMEIELKEQLNFGLLFSQEWMGMTLSSICPESAEFTEVSERVQLFRIKNFLSDEECEYIISSYKEHLEPGSITGDSPDFRTSRTCEMNLALHLKDKEKIENLIDLDIKISNLMNIHPLYSEGIQFQYYQAGEYFKPHTDYFQPQTREYDEYAKVLGQRTWTFMVYLNDVEQGGETNFPKLDASIVPEKGMALAWNNLDDKGNVVPETLHEGQLVEKGYKAIITKWFRDKRAV